MATTTDRAFEWRLLALATIAGTYLLAWWGIAGGLLGAQARAPSPTTTLAPVTPTLVVPRVVPAGGTWRVVRTPPRRVRTRSS